MMKNDIMLSSMECVLTLQLHAWLRGAANSKERFPQPVHVAPCARTELSLCPDGARRLPQRKTSESLDRDSPSRGAVRSSMPGYRLCCIEFNSAGLQGCQIEEGSRLTVANEKGREGLRTPKTIVDINCICGENTS